MSRIRLLSFLRYRDTEHAIKWKLLPFWDLIDHWRLSFIANWTVRSQLRKKKVNVTGQMLSVKISAQNKSFVTFTFPLSSEPLEKLLLVNDDDPSTTFKLIWVSVSLTFFLVVVWICDVFFKNLFPFVWILFLFSHYTIIKNMTREIKIFYDMKRWRIVVAVHVTQFNFLKSQFYSQNCHFLLADEFWMTKMP